MAHPECCSFHDIPDACALKNPRNHTCHVAERRFFRLIRGIFCNKIRCRTIAYMLYLRRKPICCLVVQHPKYSIPVIRIQTVYRIAFCPQGIYTNRNGSGTIIQLFSFPKITCVSQAIIYSSSVGITTTFLTSTLLSLYFYNIL
jgi:hypothetical protein